MILPYFKPKHLRLSRISKLIDQVYMTNHDLQSGFVASKKTNVGNGLDVNLDQLRAVPHKDRFIGPLSYYSGSCGYRTHDTLIKSSAPVILPCYTASM